MHTDTIADAPEQTRLPHLLAVAILVVVAGLSFGAFYAPAIYSDDWTLVVERFANGGAWVD